MRRWRCQLREVHAEYMQKIGSQRDDVIKEYLRRFLAKKALSGGSVRSLAFVFSLNKVADAKAAQLLAAVGKELEQKPVSVGKVLFLAERILTDPAALALLQPLKDHTIEYTYGSQSADAASMFAASQVLLAEVALRTFTLNLPDTVQDLTDAREAVTEEARLLGLSAEQAMVGACPTALLDQNEHSPKQL